MQDFVCASNTNNTGYFFFEFMDEPWKVCKNLVLFSCFRLLIIYGYHRRLSNMVVWKATGVCLTQSKLPLLVHLSEAIWSFDSFFSFLFVANNWRVASQSRIVLTTKFLSCYTRTPAMTSVSPSNLIAFFHPSRHGLSPSCILISLIVITRNGLDFLLAAGTPLPRTIFFLIHLPLTINRQRNWRYAGQLPSIDSLEWENSSLIWSLVTIDPDQPALACAPVAIPINNGAYHLELTRICIRTHTIDAPFCSAFVRTGQTVMWARLYSMQLREPKSIWLCISVSVGHPPILLHNIEPTLLTQRFTNNLATLRYQWWWFRLSASAGSDCDSPQGLWCWCTPPHSLKKFTLLTITKHDVSL